jgi:hypothetical protein
MEDAQRQRDRRFIAAIRREKGADPSGLDQEGFGLCWRCRSRRSKRPGVARLICRKCEKELLEEYAAELKAKGRSWLTIQPETPLGEIRGWIWGEKE